MCECECTCVWMCVGVCGVCVCVWMHVYVCICEALLFITKDLAENAMRKPIHI